MKRTLVYFIFSWSWTLAFSQLEYIHPDSIADRKIRNLVITNADEQNVNTCFNQNDSNLYQFHHAEFVVDQPIDEVWSNYTDQSLWDVWNTRKIKLRCLTSNTKKQVFYSNAEENDLEAGQLIFLKLRLAGGLLRLGVGFEVTELDPVRKQISYCYIKNGKSEGTQSIRFVEEEGKTKIIHDTHYKSQSPFRDEKLYPFYHQRAIIAMHAGFNQTSIRKFRKVHTL